MAKVVLEARSLSRSFGSYQAVAPVDLKLQTGTIVALMGSNGAGKSTLMLCLSGLLFPSSGDVWVEGFPLYGDEIEAKRRLAFVPDTPSFYPELSLWEHLVFMATAHGAMAEFDQRASTLLDEFGLLSMKDVSPILFSRGMRLKAGILLALMRPFRVLLLDEPDAAIDVTSRRVLGHHLERLRSEGAAVLFSSHDPGFSSETASQIWWMERGSILTQGP